MTHRDPVAMGGKLIAEFMGGKTHKQNDWTFYFIGIELPSNVKVEMIGRSVGQDQLRYHLSWDWQNPVWVKALPMIKKIMIYPDKEDQDYPVPSDEFYLFTHHYREAFDKGDCLAAFNALVEMIEFINANKTK